MSYKIIKRAGGASTAFTIIQPTTGTSPTADSDTDTLILTSSDGSVIITGNSTTDTLDFVAAGVNKITGPSSATDNAVVRFDATTGKLAQNSLTIIDDSGNLTTNGINISGQTASRVAVFDSSKNVTSSTVTSTTLAFVDLTSSGQTQLDGMAKLVGRSGGQTLQGDTASGGNLVLESTAHATKGVIQSKDPMRNGALAPASYTTPRQVAFSGSTDEPAISLHDSAGALKSFMGVSKAAGTASLNGHIFFNTNGVWQFTDAATGSSALFRFQAGQVESRFNGFNMQNSNNSNNMSLYSGGSATSGGGYLTLQGVDNGGSGVGGNVVLSTGSTTAGTIKFNSGGSNTNRIILTAAGNFEFQVIGNGIKFKEGTNAVMGTATLVGGTVTVSNTTVTASSRIFIQRVASGGTIGTALTYTISAGTSFTINSDNVLDTSTVNWVMFIPS